MTGPAEPTVVRLPEPDGLPHRMGRHVNHDPASRSYRFPRSSVPVRTVRWTRRCPILNQGQLGSCTGNAAAGWLGTDDSVQKGRADVTEALAVDLYSAATAADPFDGSWPPDDTGSDGLSVAKVLKQRGLIGAYTHCFGLPDVLAALQDGPVITGTNWYSGMFNPGPRGVVSISGKVVGGHEYLIVGVDVARQEVTFDNSWGTSWGDAGSGRMSYATYGRLLAEDGDATVLHAPVTVPGPPGPLPFRVDLELDAETGAAVAARAAHAKVTPSTWCVQAIHQRLRH